jgi:hypothetical protein
MGGAGMNGTRSLSVSVDVNRRGRDELEEKEGETIVDLGRRATSDVGGVKEKEKAPPMPTDSPTIKTAGSSKGYSSDTAMVRKDPTKKQTPAPVDPVIQYADISSTSTSTPSRIYAWGSTATTTATQGCLCCT